MNSSFNSIIANMSAKSERFTKYRLKPQSKKNDVTAEVTHFSTFNNSESQCFTSDINSAITVMYDIGQLLALIHYEKIPPHATIALARLTHDAAETSANLLQVQLNAINETLVMTGYNKVGD